MFDVHKTGFEERNVETRTNLVVAQCYWVTSEGVTVDVASSAAGAAGTGQLPPNGTPGGRPVDVDAIPSRTA